MGMLGSAVVCGLSLVVLAAFMAFVAFGCDDRTLEDCGPAGATLREPEALAASDDDPLAGWEDCDWSDLSGDLPALEAMDEADTY